MEDQHSAIAELVAEHRVRDFVAHAAAVGGEEGFAAGIAEEAAGGGLSEVAGLEFAFLKRGDRQRVGDERAERSHQIESQRGAARA